MGILSNFTNLCRFRPDVGLWTKLRTFIKLAGGRRAEQEQKNYQVDVLFIFPPHARFFGHMAFTFPLGLGWLVSYLKERGISSMIYHMDYFKKDMRWRFMSILDHRIARCVTLWDDFNKHLEDPDDHLWNTLREFIRQTNPKIVGVTATAITLKSALVTARIAKEVNPNIKVVIGGPAATTQTEKVQANENVDFVLEDVTEPPSKVLATSNESLAFSTLDVIDLAFDTKSISFSSPLSSLASISNVNEICLAPGTSISAP